MHGRQSEPIDGQKGGWGSESLSVSLSLSRSLCLDFCPCICRSINLPQSLYLSFSLSLSISLPIYLLVCPSTCLSISPDLYLHLYLYLFIYSSFFLSMYLTGSDYAGLPSKGKVDRFKAKPFHDTSSNNWCSELQKRSNSVRLPSKSEKVSAELMASCQCLPRLTTKWGQVIRRSAGPVTQNHLSKLTSWAQNLRNLILKKSSHLQPLARVCKWLQVAASGCLWVHVVVVAASGGCGCKWLLVAASGCLWVQVVVVAASGGCGCKWLLVAASGCKWLQVAACASVCKWLQVAASGYVAACPSSCFIEFSKLEKARIRELPSAKEWWHVVRQFVANSVDQRKILWQLPKMIET